MTAPLPSVAEVEENLAVWSGQYPLLRSLLDQRTPAAKALRYTGLRLCENGVTDTVVGMFMAATALAPEDAGLWNDLGTVLNGAGQTGDAIACLRESLRRNPEQPNTWVFLGLLHQARSEWRGAEEAFLAALKLDPRLGAALHGLGLVYFKQRRFALAAERLNSAIACGETDASVHACLGLAFWNIGRFGEAAQAFAGQVQIKDEPAARRNWAQTRMADALIAGAGAEEALGLYRETAGADGEDSATASATAFHQLSGFGHREAAIRIGRHRLSCAPDDPVQRYLLSALEQNAPARAPDDYLRSHFDAFAERFDRQLVDVLDYRVPEELAALVGPRFARVLELGCGTGLAGPFLRPKCAHLTGVDISPRMLQKAGERGLYDQLIESEILDFLAAGAGPFDLVFAADVVIYFGDLTALMAAVAPALAPGGLFAFSIETTEGIDFAVLPSGRFAHALAYIEDVTRSNFRLVTSQPATIRIEANSPAKGALVVLARR